MTVPHSSNLGHLLKSEARAGTYRFQLLTPAPLPMQRPLYYPSSAQRCLSGLFPSMAREARAGSLAGSVIVASWGRGVDSAINTQKDAKRLQLWARGCGGLGLGVGWGGVRWLGVV